MGDAAQIDPSAAEQPADHRFAQAVRLAYADRARYLADPDFVQVPVAGLLDTTYARRRAAAHPWKGRLARVEAGSPEGAPPAAGLGASREHPSTTHLSVVDEARNMVALTSSVEQAFGSGMIVPGGGYVLNDRMPYFSLDPNDVNVLVPGKRTRHTVNPALALKNGKPYLAWNTPGGDNQPQAMLQAFLNVVVFGMNVQQAVEAATVTSSAFAASMHPQPVKGKLTMPRVLADSPARASGRDAASGEESQSVAEALAAKGHHVEIVELQQPYKQSLSGAGAVKLVMIDPDNGVMHGGVSPAKDDYVLGW